MAVAGLKALREFVIRLFLKEKPKGVMTALPNKELVDMNTAVVAEKLMRNGIDPRSLKNANQVENAIKMIDDRPKVQEGITSAKSAKVFDMEGKEIDPKKGIMGGKQIDDLPPPGSRGGKDDIAAPVQSSEETIKNMIEAENKKNIGKMRNRKMVKDAIDNASPGFVRGDRKYNAQLVAEDLAEKKFGKEFYDLDQRQQMDLYDEALEGLSKQTRDMPDPDDFAQGGRAGFSKGKLVDLARRKFLKAAAGVGAGIGALKTGLLGLGKQAPETIQKVTENFSTTLSEAPQYFLDLVTKIKTFGKKSKIGPQERMDEYSYTGKNGDQYTLTEDIVTGDAQIVKDKMGVGSYGDKTFDTINDRTVMEYKAPKQDVDVEAGKGTREAAEYEEYKVEFDQDGTQAGADAIDEIVQKEIIEEAKTADIPPIKKASGGIARLLGE